MARLRRRPARVFRPLLILPAALLLLTTGSGAPSPNPSADPASNGAAPPAPITARVPFNILMDDLQEGAGVAVAPDGTIFVADRRAAVIYRWTPDQDGSDGTLVMPFAGLIQLQAPVGLWLEELEEDQNLLVADEGRGQVWRLNGGASLVAEGLTKPRWLVRDGTRSLYITADGLSGQAGVTGGSRREGNVLLRLPGGSLPAEILLSGLQSPQGLAAPIESVLPVTVEKFQSSGESVGPAILGVRLDRPPGDQEHTQVLLGAGALQPGGMARDALGALWLAAGQWQDPTAPSSAPVRGVVAKVLPGGGVSILVQGLVSPKGLAFGPGGHLHLAEERRLLRLRAPDPPRLSPEPPSYTNQAALHLAGSALPDATITARTDSGTATTRTDPQTGLFSFSKPLPLTANREDTVEVFATSLAGSGLTSGPSDFRVLHDDLAPTVSARSDPAGPYLRGQVRLIAEAQDSVPDGGAASGLARLTLRLLDAGSNEVARTAVEGSGTAEPLLTSHSVDTARLPDGLFTLEAIAEDRAGNAATATAHFTVANLTIRLESPASGSTVPEGPVLVQGTVETSAPDVGVIVNDVVAHVHAGTFAALVPLEAGKVTLTILATDSFGATASATGNVTVASGLPVPDLRITPESGLAPLSVEFTAAEASPGNAATFTIDFGDRSPPHVATNIEGVSHTYALPGLYLPTLTVTEATGQVTIVRRIVQAHAATSLDALLQGKWDTFRTALSRGDIGGALSYVATSAREKYRRVFEDLGSTLPSVAGQLQDIHLLEVLPGYAGYATYRQRQGEMFLYFIEFVQDADGLWRLENM